MTYMSRMMRVGDEFEATPTDAQHLLRRRRVEEVVDEAPQREYRRRPAAEPEASETDEANDGDKPLEDLSVAALRRVAEQRGIDLPARYVRHDRLVKMIRGEALDDDNGEEDDGA
jgi:hypothetical protein